MEDFDFGKNVGIFYFSHMTKFANFEFMFSIQGPKLVASNSEIELP